MHARAPRHRAFPPYRVFRAATPFDPEACGTRPSRCAQRGCCCGPRARLLRGNARASDASVNLRALPVAGGGALAQFHIKKDQAADRNLRLEIFDKDQFSADDFMGMVTLPGQMVWDLSLIHISEPTRPY